MDERMEFERRFTVIMMTWFNILERFRGMKKLAGWKKVRFVVKLSNKSKNCEKHSVQMYSLLDFALSIKLGDCLIYIDIEMGYRKFSVIQRKL